MARKYRSYEKRTSHFSTPRDTWLNQSNRELRSLLRSFTKFLKFFKRRRSRTRKRIKTGCALPVVFFICMSFILFLLFQG